MAVDLHTHSTASDGSVSPAHLMRMAADIGLKAIALTDHDTLEGIPEARATAQELGITLIPGVEMSLHWDRGEMHMLALWLEPGPGPLQDRLDEIQESRNLRNQRIVERLQESGVKITFEEVKAEAGTGMVGRPHIAAVLVKNRQVESPEEAFERFLSKNSPTYVERKELEPEEAIRLTLESHALPILCHPHTVRLDNAEEYSRFYKWLVGAGLVGLECHYATYDRPTRERMVRMAREFGLIPSGGSDFHGDYKPNNRLGLGVVGIEVPDEVYFELLASHQGPSR